MSLWLKTFSPMLLHEIDEPFNSKEFLYELKFDGIRALIFVNQKFIKIVSRNGKDITSYFKELESIKELVLEDTILDGEIIVMDNNKISFSKVLKKIRVKDKNKISFETSSNPATFVAFDILYLNKDLTNLKLMERKKILDRIQENDELIISKIFVDGIKLFENVKKNNLEGIVAKKKDSLYYINKRSYEWLKIKNIKDDEFYIGGYEIKKNGISLLLGEYVNNKLVFVGKVLMNKKNSKYNSILNSKKISKSPFSNYIDNSNYIEPKLKITVSYLEKKERLRHPVIKGE